MADSDNVLAAYGKSLEEAFFLKEDQKLIDEMRSLRKLKESKENLAKVSGIHNEKVLEKLVELNIQPDIVAAMAVIPLVEVAWADGKVDAKEQSAILKGAEKSGIEKGGTEHELLERWLTHKPEATLLEAWQHYIQGLCEKMTPAERAGLKSELITHARDVAEASGGFLGLTSKVSKKEAAMLKTLEAAFGI